jgi:hypothetical protein
VREAIVEDEDLRRGLEAFQCMPAGLATIRTDHDRHPR